MSISEALTFTGPDIERRGDCNEVIGFSYFVGVVTYEIDKTYISIFNTSIIKECDLFIDIYIEFELVINISITYEFFFTV